MLLTVETKVSINPLNDRIVNPKVQTGRITFTYEYDPTYEDCNDFAKWMGYKNIDDFLHDNDIDKDTYDYVVGRIAQGKVYALEQAICLDCRSENIFKTFLSTKYADMIIEKALELTSFEIKD